MKVLKSLLYIRIIVAVLFYLGVIAIAVLHPEGGFLKGFQSAFEAKMGAQFPLSSQQFGEIFGRVVIPQLFLNGILLWALSARRLIVFRVIAGIHLLSVLTTSIPIVPALVFGLSFLKSVRQPAESISAPPQQ